MRENLPAGVEAALTAFLAGKPLQEQAETTGGQPRTELAELYRAIEDMADQAEREAHEARSAHHERRYGEPLPPEDTWPSAARVRQVIRILTADGLAFTAADVARIFGTDEEVTPAVVDAVIRDLEWLGELHRPDKSTANYTAATRHGGDPA